MWYSMTIRVPEGTGDYGSNNKQVWAGESAHDSSRATADELARKLDTTVSVFRGRDIGKLVYEAQP